jgi:acyl transferase domain-containing protein/phosphopantetheinyl transferase (holo-ACP synthase)
MRRRGPLDVAIVGMGCRFPGAADLVAFWQNILAGRDTTGEVPTGRWDPTWFHDPSSPANDRVPSRRGGYLDDPIPFDPAPYGIMPRTVEGGEPEQFLVLAAARAALEDAGLGAGASDGRRVEVVIGRGNYFNRGNLTRLQHGRIVAQTIAILQSLHPEWSQTDFDAIRDDLKKLLPPFGPDTIPGQVTNATAGCVANRFNLQGASYVVDAASASSLVALDLGARALVERRADLALVGGVFLSCDVDFPMVFAQLGALSKQGKIKPFAGDADGTLPGEGVGVVVLKRLKDAERDGDRVYAVLKGVGLASAGRRQGLTTPSARGHALAMRRAYRRAGIDPLSVSLIEGNGLGVPAADRAELRALRAVFCPAQKQSARGGWCVLGAVSSMMGHAMPAAGIGGLIKTALALHHRVLPPTLNAANPHPLLADESSPFALLPGARPWVHGGAEHPRRAGVNAFGFAGISAHALLEEHRTSNDASTRGCQLQWPSEAILLGAPDRASWMELSGALVDWLERGPDVSLKDLAYTLNVGAPPYPFRVGLVATSLEDLEARLRSTRERLCNTSCRSIRDSRGSYFWDEPLGGCGRLAFMFPGEGSQYRGMLAELCLHFPEARVVFDTADRVARTQAHARLPSELLFGQDQRDADGLWSIGAAINVVLTSQWALYQVLRKLGISPAAVVGHSSGEFLALAAAGVLQVDRHFEDALGELGTIFERLEASGAVPTAALVAVAADRSTVESIAPGLADDLSIAIDNCPHQVVLTGGLTSMEKAVRSLREQGIACETLPFARAYHSPEFRPALEPVRAFFAGLGLRSPAIPVYSCALAEQLPDDVARIRTLATEQWTLPVRFRATIEAMHRDGVRLFIDVGARGNLAGFVEDTLRGQPAYGIAANLPRRSALTQLNHLVASIWAHGESISTDLLYARRRPVRLDLSVVPQAKPRPALAVGFPEMRLSPDLVRMLRSRSVAHASNGHPKSKNSITESSDAQAIATHVNRPGDGVKANREARVPTSARNGAQVTAAAHESVATLDEAMLAHIETMDAFLKAQREVMDAYFECDAANRQGENPEYEISAERAISELDAETVSCSRDGCDADVTQAEIEPGPWIGQIQSHTPGRELIAMRTLDMHSDPIAEHHTLGGRKASAVDPERKGLPVLPFTVMAEMLAQAAAVLAPGRSLVALRDVQARKWIRYEEDPVTLEIEARAEPNDRNTIDVVIFDRGTAAAPRERTDGPVVTGQVIFGVARPESPIVPPEDLTNPRPSRFTAEELYGDQWLFHGPALRALVAVGSSTPSGIDGTLRVLPHQPLFREGERPVLLTDAIVLDSFTHLLGCWGLEHAREGDVMFPLRLKELSFFGADPPEGTDVSCRVRIRALERRRVRADVGIVGPGDRLWMRIQGWEDWRFYWPARYRDQFRQPDRFLLGEPLELPGATAREVETVRGVWLQPPADMGRPVWRDVLEWVQLAPAERAAYHQMAGPDSRKTLRLWGRIAAKDAARRLDLDRGRPNVYPSDLVIEPDERGQPFLRSLIEPDRTDLPAISIAHCEGVAVALAGSQRGARVGIDVEKVVDRPAGLEHAAFQPSERVWLEHLEGTDRTEWSARLWCAKEAVGKATGHGLVPAPTSVEVTNVDLTTGEVQARLSQHLSAACPDCDTSNVRVFTARRGDYVWAWTVLARSKS